MPSILSVGTAIPPHTMEQEEARRLARRHFSGHIHNIDKYLTVFDNSLVARRHFCTPPEWFLADHGLSETNRTYVEWAETLAVEAARKCLEEAGQPPREISHIVFVSSTGIATPSLDVGVARRIGLKDDVRRIPVFGLGCGGGAAGLAISSTLAEGSRSTVLVVSVELNSLTFQRSDHSKSNLVAASLFGDGAAAVLVGAGPGPLEILSSASLLKPGTRSLMGWDFVDSGFRVVFSRRVPAVIQEMMPGAVARLLEPCGLEPRQIATLITHPGGRRILEAYEEVLGRDREEFRASYKVLEEFGNMSSATVLFVLDEVLRSRNVVAGEYALLAAFGPGFSAEATLLRWS